MHRSRRPDITTGADRDARRPRGFIRGRACARDHRSVDLSAATHAGETYDLVVVGAGMSGLAAAHYFIKNVGRGARVLILDNHDDFGGHAKRNEFRHDGKLLAINGGTLNIEAPFRYFETSKQLLRDIGVDLDRFNGSNKTNRDLYRSLGLGNAHFFDKETWGGDRLSVRASGGRPLRPDGVGVHIDQRPAECGRAPAPRTLSRSRTPMLAPVRIPTQPARKRTARSAKSSSGVRCQS
jgi:putative NAD(P)-binding protein